MAWLNDEKSYAAESYTGYYIFLTFAILFLIS